MRGGGEAMCLIFILLNIFKMFQFQKVRNFGVFTGKTGRFSGQPAVMKVSDGFRARKFWIWRDDMYLCRTFPKHIPL